MVEAPGKIASICGENSGYDTDAQTNWAAADGAVELLGSLISRETRLLVVLGHEHHGLCHTGELDRT